ncbi:hypothetical protein LOZ29_005972 [Ophidiomyces ophidiicola]|nr:hypothetical protein LOZ29_005972 [Ophidiomyces ophidiicola]KAI2442601.1 hypothetical protein LOZ08_002946 [Ophidiomyces ophidiicola]
MASLHSLTRSPSSRRVRNERPLNKIMENIRELEAEYHTLKAREIMPGVQGIDSDKSDGPKPCQQSETYPSIRVSLPESQYQDDGGQSGTCHSLSKKKRPEDFDDLYDVTDESDPESCPSLSSHGETRSNSSFTISDISTSSSSTGDRRRTFPTLRIPSSNFKSVMKNSPVPPTPPPKIPISPMALAKLNLSIPALLATPSLAGSLSAASDRPSTFSTPQTPDLGDVPAVDWDEQHLRVHEVPESVYTSEPSTASMSPQVDIQLNSPQDWSAILGNFPRIPVGRPDSRPASETDSDHPPSVESSNKGVQLPVNALAALRHFDMKSDPSQSSTNSEVGESGEMHEWPSHLRPKSTNDAMSASAYSGSSFTSLSLPSPGGFFASLKGQARRTWCFSSGSTPTSAIAERFYNMSWDPREETIIEQVVELDDDFTEGPSTARPPVSGPLTALRIPEEYTQPTEHSQTESEDGKSEYDAAYARELEAKAMSNFDRTTVWLATQLAYCDGSGKFGAEIIEKSPKAISPERDDNLSLTPNRKKSVKFLETVPEEVHEPPSKPLPIPESIFYLGFQHLVRNSQQQDTFLQSNLRFEAVQAGRLSSPVKHADCVAGKYELNNPVRPPYRGPFSQSPRNSKLPETLMEKAMYSNIEKEQDVLIQLQASTWAIEALKFLNGGPLVPSPAAKRLSKAPPIIQAKESGKSRVRVLDLGGQTACEWAWHLSTEYPNVKIYTAVTKEQAVSPVSGPANHTHITVPQLWKLPFKDNQFDLISARSLHLFLKSSRTPGSETMDEVDMCLKECFRCLKPGGYIEFFLMDSEIVRAGTFGSATSVEFGFNLKTRGYDPAPTKPFLSRLRKARFRDIKRAWLFLPMGSPYSDDTQIPGSSKPSPTDPEGIVGSTADIASTTGLLGGWMWEQWMLKLQVEMGRDSSRLLEETAAVIDEGRKCGAGWRCLCGWAMKPKQQRRE